MRFWLPARLETPGSPPVTTDNKEMIESLVSQNWRLKIGTIVIQKLNKLKIIGQYETSDPAEVDVLMRVGTLRFNPQDAIDEGILSYKQVMAIKPFNVKPPDEPTPDVPFEKVPETMPDFDTLSKSAMIRWALDQKPPINLDPRKKKDEMKADLFAELDRRKD